MKRFCPIWTKCQKDFTKKPYEAHISEIVQNDIQQMMNSDEEVSILYENEAHSSKIAIRRFENEKIEMSVCQDYSRGFNWEYAFVREISFYKKGDHLIIYGLCRAFRVFRMLEIENISLSGKVISKLEYIDLCGTEHLHDYDAIERWNENMTLIRKGNDFKFFKNGIQQGLTITFAGKIVEVTNKYILDDKQNLYYIAYSDVPEPRIEFVKVAENVSQVEDARRYIGLELRKKVLEEEIIKYVLFPIYQKDRKWYVGISYSTLFFDENTTPLQIANFTIDTIKLSLRNVKRVEFLKYIAGEGWMARFIYKEDESYLVYEKKLIPMVHQAILAKFSKAFGAVRRWLRRQLRKLKKMYEK